MKLKKDINKYIFRGYDLRGVYPTDIDGDVAYTIGKSYGSYIQTLGKTKCIVGHDNRYSSDELTNALLKGITETGVDVIYLGLVTTPMFYYTCIFKNIPSGVMVTASHNPKDDNGFKMIFDERGSARGKMIEEFRNFTFEGKFKDRNGEITNFDIRPHYFELMKKSLNFGNKKIKAVIDLGNGTTSIIAKELYEMFNIDLTVIYGDSDSAFPNHHPDPCVEANLIDLKKKVLELNADVGLAFDGDGDRVGVVDEKGNTITTDKYMIIIIRDIINKVSKKEFLYDVKCSKALDDEIKKLGGKPLQYRTGASYTKTKTNEENLPFGGELSGHVFFRDKFPGFDSGLYAGLRLIEILSNTDKKCSELLDGINKYYNTEELKFYSPDDKKNNVIDKIKEYCESKKYNFLTIDGVKVLYDDGFALVRVSNTGPTITARFEASTKERLESIQKEFIDLINKYNI